MKTKHTKAPWYATGVHVQSAVLNEDNYVCEAEGISTKKAEANARLIAASPELLSSLKRCLEDDAGDLSPETVHLAMEAIAKAEGRDQ